VPYGLLMKYLLNVPLAIGAIAQLIFTSFALMSGPWAGWEDGPSRGAMAFIMFEPAAVSWLMLLVAAIGASFTDAFDWPPVVPTRLRSAAVFALSVLVVVTLGVCMAVALGESPAVASHDNGEFRPVLVAVARIGGIAGPLVAMGWLAWLIDAPLARRHSRRPRQLIIGSLTATTIAGGIIGLQMLSEEIVIDRKVAAFDKQMIDEREAENQAALKELTDASPLVDWLRLTDPLQTPDIRNAAVRRLAKRPTLEQDLGQSLQSDDTYEPDWALHLFVLLDFKPSTALEAPLRAYIAALGRRIEVSRQTAGDGLHDETYLDRWFGDQLAQLVVVTREMAESAGIDLRDTDRQLAQTIAATYPTSKAAMSFPRDISALDRHVEAVIADRQSH
jgi:hypothetical protein